LEDFALEVEYCEASTQFGFCGCDDSGLLGGDGGDPDRWIVTVTAVGLGLDLRRDEQE
jgi:hypothetical protein